MIKEFVALGIITHKSDDVSPGLHSAFVDFKIAFHFVNHLGGLLNRRHRETASADIRSGARQSAFAIAHKAEIIISDDTAMNVCSLSSLVGRHEGNNPIPILEIIRSIAKQQQVTQRTAVGIKHLAIIADGSDISGTACKLVVYQFRSHYFDSQIRIIFRVDVFQPGGLRNKVGIYHHQIIIVPIAMKILIGNGAQQGRSVE